jgi:hypothetical protein
MHALTRDTATLEAHCPALAVAIDLRFPRLRLPPAWRPAMMTAWHVAVGAGLGAVLGAASGHTAFWTPVGIGLGAALEAVVRRS